MTSHKDPKGHRQGVTSHNEGGRVRLAGFDVTQIVEERLMVCDRKLE